MQATVHERMLDYVTTNGLSRKAIAANMGISESRLSLLLNGKRKLTVDDYVNFCAAVAVTPLKFIAAAS